MYSIKHIEDGQECVMAVLSVSFNAKENVLIGYGSPGPDEGPRVGGVVRFSSGHAFVMNENGKTVAAYNLSIKNRSAPNGRKD